MMKWILFIALVIGWPLYTWFTEYNSGEAWSNAFLGFLIFVLLVVPLGDSSGEPIGGL
ncbi:MAG: hypothetical protein IKY98_02010 [Alphaproteobacteria bacterium]|nr:hypothetical protein [Alphaproteobacteria bacterium]